MVMLSVLRGVFYNVKVEAVFEKGNACACAGSGLKFCMYKEIK